MAIDVGNPEERRADLVAALKALLAQEPLIVDDAIWSPSLGDRGREVFLTGPCAITLPNDPELPLGYSVVIRRVGAGAVTLAAASGAILQPAVGSISAQYLSATVTVVVNTGSALTWAAEGAVA